MEQVILRELFKCDNRTILHGKQAIAKKLEDKGFSISQILIQTKK